MYFHVGCLMKHLVTLKTPDEVFLLCLHLFVQCCVGHKYGLSPVWYLQCIVRYFNVVTLPAGRFSLVQVHECFSRSTKQKKDIPHVQMSLQVGLVENLV